MIAPGCLTVTMEEWARLLETQVLLYFGSIVVWTLVRDLDRYEYRVRRFLRRRRIRAIRARRVPA